MIKKILSLSIAISLLLATFSLSFAENDKTPEEKINHLMSIGVIKGYQDGTLRLETPIRRSEISVLITGLMIEDGEDIMTFKDMSYFSDVKKDDWMSAYVNFLFKKLIVKGYSDNTFKPNNEVRFNEAIVMIVRGLEIEVEVRPGDSWADPYIRRAKEYGILDGITITDYSDSADRHRIFELIYNTLEFQK